MIKSLFANLVDLYHREPARVLSGAAAAIVFVAAKFGIVVSEQDLLPSLAIVLPIILSGERTRSKVSPAE